MVEFTRTYAVKSLLKHEFLFFESKSEFRFPDILNSLLFRTQYVNNVLALHRTLSRCFVVGSKKRF